MACTISIIDDTDDATLENVEPIYAFLIEHGITSTKTVWVYPPKDRNSRGDSLQRVEYLRFIRELHSHGFEIALHGVGSGDYQRNDVIRGLKEFEDKLGFTPTIHVNHSYNRDSIYGGYKRFNAPIRQFIPLLYPQYGKAFGGDDKDSEYFWGDLHKNYITYIRNHELRNVDTLAADPSTPYVDPNRQQYANYWFSCTFAPNQDVFARAFTNKRLQKLSKCNGTSIISTHLGYYNINGNIDNRFKTIIQDLCYRHSARFLPVTSLLNQRAEERRANGNQAYPVISRFAKLRLEVLHLATRIYYRYIDRQDDYAFKDLNRDMFVGGTDAT